MDEARLHELEAQIAQQQTVLVECRQAARRQQERVDALRRELELLRAVLADAEPQPAAAKQTDLPF